MTEALEFAKDLIDFVHSSPSPFHVVESAVDLLAANGFDRLEPTERWILEKGGKYYITQNGSAIIAFRVGHGHVEQEGFRLVAAHTDAPSFRIKPSPEIVVEKAYLKLITETYGSPILNTWLDRPLSMAGRASLKADNPLRPETRLVLFDKPLVIIPNQSLHMNRKVNEGIELNKQTDMAPLLAGVSGEFEKDGLLARLLAAQLGVDVARVIDFDLFLHDFDKGCLVGLNEEFISSTRLDDLAMVHAGLHALLDTETDGATNVLVCYDNEEVGSRTKQGAASPFLRTLLERVVLGLGKDREDFLRAVYRSFFVSADMGHGLHPNAIDKHDPVNRPILNGGPMIKIAANQNFTSESDTAAAYETLCREVGIPVQRFVSRSDLTGGTTVGPISATHLEIRSVDVGNPVMAMHSIRELAGVQDHLNIKRSFEAFYGA